MGDDKPTLLTLPGEMRNKIYDAYLEDFSKSTTVTISNGSQTAPSLGLTCRQFKREVLSQWTPEDTQLAHVQVLKARVVDLDFEPLVDFLEDAEKETRDRFLQRLQKLDITWGVVNGS